MIQEFLEQQRIEYFEEGEHHHVREGWIGVDCPYCGSTECHMGINIDRAYSVCWKCGPHSLLKLLVDLTGQPWSVCKEVIKSIQKRPGTDQELKQTGTLKIPSGVGSLEYAHLKYLIKRGFDPVITEKLWGVKGISLSSRLAWRLWIPIYYRGELVSWTTRDINDNSGLRYISASKDEEKIPHKNLLYGEDLAHHAIIIHEGPLDAWKTGPGGVAIMGLLWTPAQFQKMIQYPVRVVCFDNEIEAQKRADKLANELKCYPGETHIIQIESGEDVAAASEEEVAEIRDCFLV